MRLEISLAPNNQFTLHLPSPLEGRGHEVTLPFSEAGMVTLRRILREQKSLERRVPIGRTASPVQHMVDAWLKENKEKLEVERRYALEQIALDHPHINFEGL